MSPGPTQLNTIHSDDTLSEDGVRLGLARAEGERLGNPNWVRFPHQNRRAFVLELGHSV